MLRKSCIASLLLVALCAGAEEAYLQSDGSQRIDVGLSAGPNTKVAVDFVWLSTTVQQCIFGHDYEADLGNNLSFSSYINGSGCYAFADQNGVGNWLPFGNNAATAKVVAGTRRVVTVDSPGKQGSLADESGNVVHTYNFNSTRTRTNFETMWLFAAQRSGQIRSNLPAHAKVYSFKVWENGRLVRFMLPYVNGEVSGMKDALTGTIYTDMSGLSFTGGGDLGIYDRYNADELDGATLCADYRLVGGKLLDTTLPYWRQTGNTLEYRVRFVNPYGTVTADGRTGSVVDVWRTYGSPATISASADMGSGAVFRKWTGSTGAIASGSVDTEAITLNAAGPCEMTVAVSQTDDPYADAAVLIKGWQDANGDGVLQADETRSALALATPWASASPYNSPVLTNEWVTMPYRGTKRLTTALTLAQPVTITNAELNTGTCRIQTLPLNNLTSAAGITSEDMTFMLRFRPDDKQMRTDYVWIFNWGYANQASGFNLGLTHSGKATTKVILGTVTNEVTYQTYTPNFFKTDNANQPFSNAGGVVHANKWHDLIMSFDAKARKIRYLLCRASWDADVPPWSTAEQVSNNSGVLTWSNEVAMTTQANFSYKPSANFLLGSESSYSGVSIYTNNGFIAGNYTKCFRGSVHQFAVWNRSLSFDEMKKALAWPRADLMRVGVRDGSSGEFRGGSACGEQDRDWTLPGAFAADASAQVTFVADRKGENEMDQLFRWYATPDSAEGQMRLSVNGTPVGVRSVHPGRTTTWKVRGGTFADGTNTLTLARVDAGSGLVRLDAAALGGSWQIGHKNGNYMEFAHEVAGQRYHDVLNGSWYSLKRVLFGSVPSAAGSSGATNTIFRFTVPVEFQGGNYSWTLGWKDIANSANHYPRWRLNGHDLDYAAAADAQYHSIPLPGEWLNAGVNELEIYNGGSFVKNSYYSYDYWRVMVSVRNGTIMLFR